MGAVGSNQASAGFLRCAESSLSLSVSFVMEVFTSRLIVCVLGALCISLTIAMLGRLRLSISGWLGSFRSFVSECGFSANSSIWGSL